jgi:hypothetical protein
MWVFYAHKNPNLLNQKSHDCELDQSEASIVLNQEKTLVSRSPRV